MKFLILGASGMAGHTIAIYLKERGHEVVGLTRRPIKFCNNIIADVSDFEQLKKFINNDEYDFIINAVGLLNSDADENKHKAVLINSYLPHYISDLTKDMKTKIIHMSTDCVFSGKTGGYTEESLKDGETFYDRSKALGELNNSKDITFRNSIIGPDMNESGIGLFNWFMKQTGDVSGYTKAIWTGVTTLTLAKAMEKVANDNIVGVYNLVNNNTINKYDMLNIFNEKFKKNSLNISKNESVILDKSLINSRSDFDFKIPSYEEMIQEMKEWVYDHKDLYPHYF